MRRRPIRSRALRNGRASDLGIDGSERMVHAAQTSLADTRGTIVHGDIEDFRAVPASVDVVVSRMALHYVQDIAPVMTACHDALASGGRMIFSVLHPVITAHDPRATTDEPRAGWVVDHYFQEGSRTRASLGGTVTWYHRTIESYTHAVADAGLAMSALSALSECPPQPTPECDPDEIVRHTRVPLFLLIAATRQ